MTCFSKINFSAISIFLIISFAVVMMSCESNKHIFVKVFDSKTMKPLDSVFMQVNAGKNGDYNKSTTLGYTNTSGLFEKYLMIGCSGGCYDIYIQYSKKGYVEKKDFNVTEGNILLTPIQ